MVLRASFSCDRQLRPRILSAAWIFLALVISPTVIAAEDIFKCDFEFDECGVLQSGKDWVRKSGPTAIMDAGPEGGYDKSKFYFFPDNLKSLQVSEFSTPDIRSPGVVCIQFAYMAHGTRVGRINVYTQKRSDEETRKVIWQSPDVNLKNWVLEQLPYSVESNERIIWRAMSGGTGEEMAVDSILISSGACELGSTSGTTCTENEWKVEEGILSPGGIFWANLNTADLCKARCAQTPQCLAVDLLDEAGHVLCYHHIKTFSLREVIKVAGASQHTIVKRCSTGGVDGGQIPVLTSDCRRLWKKRDNFFSLGGKFLTDVRSASDCREACVNNRACIAVDIQWGSSSLDNSLVCQLHVDRTRLLVPLLMENTEQWELVERCSLVDVELSRDFTTKPFEEDGCLRQWEERENTHYVGGAYFTTPNSSILMPRTCLAGCLGETNCIAVDMNFGRSPIECWLFTTIANRSKSYSTANIRHYYLAKGCASNTTTTIATPIEEEGSGSDGGEGSGDPDPGPVVPKPRKPRDCKTLSWERQPGFYSIGGKKASARTLEQCLDGCVNDAKCQGIDFHEQGDCIMHLDAADFYYVLSGPKWIQYQLIGDCGTMPTKERPGKTEFKSDCTRGVLKKEYLMSPSAVFYDKVSSAWQCLDLCIHNKKCMAAEIHKVGRSLECFYHYNTVVFNVLLTSNNAVLYVLSQQCIRLREKDLAPPPLTKDAVLIPILDLDKDDDANPDEKTYCEEATCYVVVKTSFTWSKAQRECEMRHGKLVSVRSPRVQRIIENLLKIHKITDTMWIGASVINEIAFTNQSVSLWRVVQGTGYCDSRHDEFFRELLSRAVTSQGCFIEAKEMKEKEFAFNATIPEADLTPSACLDACQKQGYSYAGTQAGTFCSCGNSFGMYGSANDCTELCRGDNTQNCGGIGSHAVFKSSADDTDFLMWNYDEPKNTSVGHWCGAFDMFGIDTVKRLASRQCNEDNPFFCQLSASSCETGESNYYKASWGPCVYFGKDTVTWHQARERCLAMSGDLLIVNSAEKRKEIQEKATTLFPGLSKRYIWIGLFSRIYYWDDVYGGSELCYTKFSQGEPVFQKNCLYLDPTKNFEWFSGSCEDEKHEFICEIDTSKGELALKRPKIEIVESAPVDEKKQQVQQPLDAAASTDEEYDSEEGGKSAPLTGLEIALISAIGVVAVALLVGGTMYGVNRQRKRDANRQQEQTDAEMHQPSGPAESATSGSRTASRQPSNLSAASQQKDDIHSAGSPSLKQSRESQSVKFEGAPGSGIDSTSGGAPLSASASSGGASVGAGSMKGSTRGSTRGD